MNNDYDQTNAMERLNFYKNSPRTMIGNPVKLLSSRSGQTHYYKKRICR